MPPRHIESLLRANAFEVLIGDRELGFATVSRLTSETDVDSPEADRHRFAPVVLTGVSIP